jgi:hypothetical protein
MRFYLDLPLVVGYGMMAVTACLGMLQYVAARGGYGGLMLFVSTRIAGTSLGLMLILASVAGYLALAPYILTPGPAGTEVAAMFALCALAALVVTLVGADWRIRRKYLWTHTSDPNRSSSQHSTMVYYPPPFPTQNLTEANTTPCVVVVIPDPAGFVTTPESVIAAFTRAGIGLLVAPIDHPSSCNESSLRLLLSQKISDALALLPEFTEIQTSTVGVLGMGIAGDIALGVACTKESGSTPTLAVSPLVSGNHRREVTKPGLCWLHELSYRQAWRWRRSVPSLLRFTIAHYDDVPPFPRTGKQPSSKLLTTRSDGRGISRLEVSSDRVFTLLEDDSVLQQVVDWFQGQSE